MQRPHPHREPTPSTASRPHSILAARALSAAERNLILLMDDAPVHVVAGRHPPNYAVHGLTLPDCLMRTSLRSRLFFSRAQHSDDHSAGSLPVPIVYFHLRDRRSRTKLPQK